MHEREGAEQGLRYSYKLLDLEALKLDAAALPQLLAAAEQDGFAGLNITHPCKQAVIPLLHELSAEAKSLHAVNTVVFKNGRRIGHNTDWWGFAENFRRNLPGAPRGQVVQLGAGGAGAAVAYAALLAGVERLDLHDTVVTRAEQLAANLAACFGPHRIGVSPDLGVDLARADGLINTTPVGMAKYPGLPLDAALLRCELWVADIVYVPLETELLRRARALGCRTLDGGGMAVFQAVEAFRLFTGIAPDGERMLRHFNSLIRNPAKV